MPLVERRKVVERDPACCGNCPLQAPQWRRSHSLVGGELRETNPCSFMWFASLSCFSSIFDLLPLRSTWVCYLCVQGSLPCLWSSTKATHQVWFVLEVKRCLKLFLQVLCATLVWPMVSHPILQGKLNAFHVCARINIHTHDRQNECNTIAVTKHTRVKPIQYPLLHSEGWTWRSKHKW
jgi:hypothetical protein